MIIVVNFAVYSAGQGYYDIQCKWEAFECKERGLLVLQLCQWGYISHEF